MPAKPTATDERAAAIVQMFEEDINPKRIQRLGVPHCAGQIRNVSRKCKLPNAPWIQCVRP